MPHESLKLRPGVNVEATPSLLEASYQYASPIRYRDGLPEKIGGWTKYYNSVVSGTPRRLHAWGDLNAQKYLASGTTSNLDVITNSTLSTITPQTTTSNFAPNFTTTSGSTTVEITDSNVANVSTQTIIHVVTPIAVGGVVLHGTYAIIARTGTNKYTIAASSAATSSVSSGGAVPVFDTTAGSNSVQVTLAAHNLAVGNTISLPISTTVGGLTISGVQSVRTAPTSSTFTVETTSTALTTQTVSMNSGQARIVYYIAVGPDILTPTTFGMLGFGAYGQFAYGDAGSGVPTTTATQTGTAIAPTNWSLDNLVSFLVACPTGGAMYYWINNRNMRTAFPMSAQAPIYNEGCFVSQGARIVVAYGSTARETIGVSQDPLLVRWCHIEDFASWVGTATNYAGSYRIPTGSRIVGGLSTRKTDIIFTDLDCYAMTFLGGQGTSGSISLVYAFNRVDTNCGLIAKNAVTSFQGGVYWMGNSNFFKMTNDGIQPIACPVWDAVFQDLDRDNVSKIWCTGNTPFNEIWWYFPSDSGSGECDRYVKLNTLSGAWDYGPVSGTTSLVRTCGIDQSVLGMPIMAAPTGYIYQHETGRDADGSPISWAWQTGWFALREGDDYPFVDLILPDFKFGTFAGSNNASIALTVYGRDELNTADADEVYGPYTITATSGRVETRIRNRYISIKCAGSDSATFSRLGRMQFRIAADGGR